MESRPSRKPSLENSQTETLLEPTTRIPLLPLSTYKRMNLFGVVYPLSQLMMSTYLNHPNIVFVDFFSLHALSEASQWGKTPHRHTEALSVHKAVGIEVIRTVHNQCRIHLCTYQLNSILQIMIIYTLLTQMFFHYITTWECRWKLSCLDHFWMCSLLFGCACFLLKLHVSREPSFS